MSDMKTRLDCKHYMWLYCHNHVLVALFNTGCNPKCGYRAGDDVSDCRFFEEGSHSSLITQSNEWVIEG